MLTIPGRIKTLFRGTGSDGVHKNFRAHFPDGERADITNSNIVRESLSFTESICSDNMLRFGGCERSCIEFETVGVGNILGFRIECGIEVDTSSLTAAQISAIQADPGDGVLVLAADSDIGHGYYRIPLGTFTVASCPRDHSVMSHRHVTAYTPDPWAGSPVEYGKMNWWAGGKRYSVNALVFLLASMGTTDTKIMSATGWTATSVSLPTPTTVSVSSFVPLQDEDGNQVLLWYSATVRRYRLPWNTITNQAKLGRLTLGDLDAAGLVSFVRRCCAETSIDFEASNLGDTVEEVEDVDTLLRLSLRAVIPSVYWGDTTSTWNHTRTVLDGDLFAVSAEGPSADDFTWTQFEIQTQGNLYFQIPETITLRFVRSNGDPYDQTFTTGISQTQPKAWLWSNSDPGPLADLTLTMPIAGQVTGIGVDSQKVTWTKWSPPSKIRDLISGYAELLGEMIYPGRNGMKRLHLAPTNAQSIAAGQYDSVWWDDYDISPVGRILYLYGKDHAKTGKVGIGGGRSVYDLRDNAVLAALEMTPSQVTKIVKKGLKKALKNLQGYCPAEIDMPAWPWLEPGDYLQIAAEDGTIVSTYLLKRTMTGVQMLFDHIEAPGGEEGSGDE